MTQIASKVEEFALRHLGKPQVPRSSKVIHDALWGTQLLHAHEVAFVDSPLIQRLRYLHQTGFSTLTYPSTTHSRFEHSLGVLYQCERLCRALREKYSGEYEIVSSDIQKKLRLAAILHDCSHGPFSHTSEEAYRHFDDMQELVGPGGKYEGLSPSEVLAAHIFDSGPFKEFFRHVEETSVLHFEPGEIAELVLGYRRDGLKAYETDVINGPFDADKLDYIFRDAHYSGLPLSVDLDRLWFATEIHVLKPDSGVAVQEPVRRLVISRAGVNSLEQIVAARMNLTSSFYHHHKIRATDCMFKGVVEFCRDNSAKLCGKDLSSAADFLFMTDVSFLAESERNPDSTVRDMISKILNRQLFKRALVISMNTFDPPGKPTDIGDVRESQVYKMIAGMKQPAGARKMRDLAKRIWEKAGKPGSSSELWLDFPGPPKTLDLARTFVNIGSHERPEFRTLSEFIPLDQWGKQYVLTKWRGHVFCDAAHVERVAKAAEQVLSEEYAIHFNKYARLLANLSPI